MWLLKIEFQISYVHLEPTWVLVNFAKIVILQIFIILVLKIHFELLISSCLR